MPSLVGLIFRTQPWRGGEKCNVFLPPPLIAAHSAGISVTHERALWRFFFLKEQHVAPTGWNLACMSRLRSTSPRHISPQSCSAEVGVWGPKRKILPKFRDINVPQGHVFGVILLNFRRSWQLHVRSCIKIWADSLKGFQSYRGLGLGVCVCVCVCVCYPKCAP